MPDKTAQKIQSMFNSIAPWYDFLNHFLSLGIDKHWRNKTARVLLNAETADGDVLDMCCGTGDLTAAMIRANEQWTIPRQFYGIDFSDEMIKRAVRKYANKHTAASFATGDALNIAFEDKRFVAVAVAFGLRNIADTERGLSEMIRVCKSGGTVAVLEFSMPTVPVFSQIYRFYFRYVLPFIGKMFSGNKNGAYCYLPESVLTFDKPPELRQKMERLGLTGVKSIPITLGIATLTFGCKPLL